MITLIQQGSVCDLESSEPGCQEGAFRPLRFKCDALTIFRQTTYILIENLIGYNIISI